MSLSRAVLLVVGVIVEVKLKVVQLHRLGGVTGQLDVARIVAPAYLFGQQFEFDAVVHFRAFWQGMAVDGHDLVAQPI